MSGSPEEMIQNLLSDPESLKQLGALISSFTSGKKEDDQNTKKESLLPPGLDNPEVLLKISRIFKDMSNEDDPRLTLLMALKPYLNNKRIDKVDHAIKFLKISRLTSMLGDIDLF